MGALRAKCKPIFAPVRSPPRTPPATPGPSGPAWVSSAHAASRPAIPSPNAPSVNRLSCTWTGPMTACADGKAATDRHATTRRHRWQCSNGTTMLLLTSWDEHGASIAIVSGTRGRPRLSQTVRLGKHQAARPDRAGGGGHQGGVVGCASTAGKIKIVFEPDTHVTAEQGAGGHACGFPRSKRA